MTFEDVLRDIKLLIGLELSSIRPGANITLLDVDEVKGCILIRTSQGVVRSRPISELQTIWEQLTANMAVHVEGVLHGSGTSRNQPETIFANLPYIEWLKITNKKHITYVKAKTHPYGTLRQMDSLQAAELTSKIHSSVGEKKCIAVVVSNDMASCVADMQKIAPGSTQALAQGIYRYDTANGYFLIVNTAVTKLNVGTYLVFRSMNQFPGIPITISDMAFTSIEEYGIKALIQKM